MFHRNSFVIANITISNEFVSTKIAKSYTSFPNINNNFKKRLTDFEMAIKPIHSQPLIIGTYNAENKPVLLTDTEKRSLCNLSLFCNL
jgi:hypothetical protein